IDAGMQVDEGAQAPAGIEGGEQRVLAADGEIAAVISGIERLLVAKDVARSRMAVDVHILVEAAHVEGKAPTRALHDAGHKHGPRIRRGELERRAPAVDLAARVRDEGAGAHGRETR